MDYTWAQKVLAFCKKNGFEAGKLTAQNGLPYVEINCSDKVPTDEAVKKELIAALPEGSKILYKVDVKRATVDEVSKVLEATRMPWTIQVSDHTLNIRTLLPKEHPVWDRIIDLTRKDKYIHKVQVKVLDVETMRDAVSQGKTNKEAQDIAAEKAEVMELVNLPVDIQTEIQNNKSREDFISKDDVLNLTIALNTCNTVEDFLKSL